MSRESLAEALAAANKRPGHKFCRLALVFGWSDDLLAHAMSGYSGDDEEAYEAVHRAAQDLSLSVLRGGDADLQASGARGLGFKTYEEYERFLTSNVSLSERLKARPASDGQCGRVVGVSWTEVVIEDDNGQLLCLDRTKIPDEFENGDVLVVDRFGNGSRCNSRPNDRSMAARGA